MTAITLPRLDNERPERYAARLLYVTLGPGRSLEAVRQKTGKKPASIRTLERWSSEDNWVDHARRYDDTVAHIALQEAAAQYRAELEEHRQRYHDTGKALHEAAVSMLEVMKQSLAAGTVQVECTPQNVQTLARAILVAADLEAHALDLPRLMRALDAPGSE